jgi:hypothetical protein
LEHNQKVIIDFLKIVDLVTLAGLLPKECKKEFSISWACDTANTTGVFKSLVNYKKKFSKGIISSWQDYE